MTVDHRGAARAGCDNELRASDVAALARGAADLGPLLTAAPVPSATPRAPDVPIYGLTSGVGALKHVAVADDDRGHALRLWRSHAAGVGPELDDDTARATMLVRLHQLQHGRSGVGADLYQALSSALVGGGVPRLHMVGSIGTGDITMLAELGLTLIGELPWRVAPQPDSAAVDPPDVHGQALPFISSNAATVAMAALATDDLARWAHRADEVAALSHLALRGSPQAYDPRVFDASRQPDTAAVAATMRELLGDTMSRTGHHVQDPFSLRVVPQVHGPLRAAVGQLDDAVSAQLHTPTENPLRDDDVALHHGQFTTQQLAGALDAARPAAHAVASLSARRTSALMDPANTGLAPFQAVGPPGSSGLMIVEYVVQDLLARARALAGPATHASAVIAFGVEDHAPFSTQSASATRELIELVRLVVAVELLGATRALRASPGLRVDCPALELYRAAIAVLPDDSHDRVLGPDIEALAALLDER